MTFRTRIRKIIKWTALAMTAVLLVCWIGSNWYTFVCLGESERWYFACYKGSALGTFDDAGMPGVLATRLEFGSNDTIEPFEWWEFSCESIRLPSGPIWYLRAPLWAPLLLAGGVAFAAWRLDSIATRRARNNCCKKCGYPRAGLKDQTPCPECGAASTSIT